MSKIIELRTQRGRLIEEARGILDNADAEKRALHADEQTRYDALLTESDTLKADIERRERIATEERNLDASTGRRTDTETGDSANDTLRSWLLNPTSRDLSFNLRSAAPRTTDSARWERRALSFAAGAGAELVPEGFVNALETAMLQFGGVRQVASVIRTESGNDLPWPTVNDTANEGVILGANAQVAEQDLTFDSVTLKAWKYSSKLIRVPVELLQDSAVDLASEIGARLGERIGRITNRHFTVGTGTNQPQGIVTAAPIGKTGASATAITYDELVDFVHSVDPAYRTNALFMFSDATLRDLRKLRDLDGKLIWQPSMRDGEPDRILGYGYVINQHMSNMAAAAKSMAFGALSAYKIRDALGVTLMRLNERYADFHQVGFLAISRHDGRLIDAGTNPIKAFRNA
jgi:HK97 family phage major capsid protein